MSKSLPVLFSEMGKHFQKPPAQICLHLPGLCHTSRLEPKQVAGQGGGVTSADLVESESDPAEAVWLKKNCKATMYVYHLILQPPSRAFYKAPSALVSVNSNANALICLWGVL